jgi:hypothetical protein
MDCRVKPGNDEQDCHLLSQGRQERYTPSATTM